MALVGDLMQDLAARMVGEVRDPATLDRTTLAAGTVQAGPRLKTGEYLFATIHRAENREPAAIAGWAALLTLVASATRPVVLALHPGTRAALSASGVALGPNVHVVEPLGYRSSLACQLHAAAVLTDSGGVQREAAWLGVPCLVLRGTTEWVEAVATSGGRMVVVGLDPARAVAELARLAPVESGAAAAARRAATVEVEPAEAAERISEILAGAWPLAAEAWPMSRVVMFVYNDCKTDARVLREAAALVAAGHEVTIMARPSNPASQETEREARDGFEIVRVPIPKRHRRTWTWIRSPWRTKGWIARWVFFRWKSALRRFPRGLLNALAATLFGLVMAPWAVIQRILAAIFALFGREHVPGAVTIDWIVRWRLTILAWAHDAGVAAPIADVYHGHDLTGLPAALTAARRNGAPVVYDSHEIYLEAGSTASRPRWARAIFRRIERRWVAGPRPS